MFESYHFMPQFSGSPFSIGGLLELLTLELGSRRPKLSTDQVGSLRLLWPRNSDSLKKTKNPILCDKVPFLLSYHILFPMHPLFRHFTVGIAHMRCSSSITHTRE